MCNTVRIGADSTLSTVAFLSNFRKICPDCPSCCTSGIQGRIAQSPLKNRKSIQFSKILLDRTHKISATGNISPNVRSKYVHNLVEKTTCPNWGSTPEQSFCMSFVDGQTGVVCLSKMPFSFSMMLQIGSQ